jgi:hypothetical protein
MENEEGGAMAEMDIIGAMMKRAKEQRMTLEVLWSYSNDLKAGSSIADAAAHALREWDL